MSAWENNIRPKSIRIVRRPEYYGLWVAIIYRELDFRKDISPPSSG
jgi:hypothetical protein